jgi:DNA repair protein RadA/Sms
VALKGVVYECASCGARYAKWAGKCGKCNQFSTIGEKIDIYQPGKAVGLKSSLAAGRVVSHARKVHEIDPTTHKHVPTGIGEFDRIFGGGIVKGQVLLIAGEPGVGKSTLLLEVADSVAKTGKPVLVVSGEESAEQIKLRADRIGVSPGDLFIVDEPDLSVIIGHIEEIQPTLVIIDSVQTIASPEVEGRMGGVAQVLEVASVLTRVAKQQKITMILVGQVLKDTSQIAGPQALAHIVDAVAHLNGDKNSTLRLLRVEKNRFGPADEVACFAHEEGGLKEVPDPSGLFIGRRDQPVPGTCVTVTMEGKRPLLAEVQALVAPTNAPNPRRGVSGLDAPRVQMLIAITERYGRVRLFDKDTYLATVAGMRVTEPAADLALCLALASAFQEIPIPNDMCAIGEVTLSGDMRKVPNMVQRLAEAARLGYTRAIVPDGTEKPSKGSIVLIPVSHITQAFKALAALKSPN